MFGGCTFAHAYIQELLECLSRAGVGWELLSERTRAEAENAWRKVYGHAFLGRPRLRHGARADYEYRIQECSHYLIVPFSTRVPGLPVCVHRPKTWAYECLGPLVPLGAFCALEFFIAPPNLTWSMIHTNEDHAIGGPYFIRTDWIPGESG